MSAHGWQPVFDGVARYAVRPVAPADARPPRAGSRRFWHASLAEELSADLSITTFDDRPPTGRLDDRPVWLGFSSTEGHRACIWSSDRAVGIDIERIRSFPDAERMLRLASDDAEVARIHSATNREDRADALLRIWTAKEAVLKVIGTGLGIPPGSVSLDRVTADGCSAAAGGHRIGVRWLTHPLCVVAIAIGAEKTPG